MYLSSTLLTRFFVIFFSILLSSATSLFAETSIEDELLQALQSGVAAGMKLRAHGLDAKTIDQRLLARYTERGFLPYWVENTELSSRASEARETIREAELDGLDPQDYFLDLINQRWDRKDSKSLAELDMLLTLGISRLSADGAEGRIEPYEIDSKLFEGDRPNRPDLKAVISNVLTSSEVKKSVRELFPQHKQYANMKTALASYREISKRGGWKLIILPAKSVLRPGATGNLVIALSEHLKITKDLAPNKSVTDTYDAELTAAVKRFQERHGLPASGEINAKTLAELNVTVEERIESLLINLERWRWLRANFSEGKEVLVNIAGYELFGIESGTPTLRLPVIVGKSFHATPVFSDLIRYIEMNPYWNVTPSIAKNEMLPKLKKDSGYLAKQHMRLYDGWGSSATEISARGIKWSSVTPAQMGRYAIRQDPGAWNALGTLKFVFPNSYNVYLHDTASRNLFSEKERAFSHGCIRVKNPDQLAAFLLDTGKDRWSTEKVKEYISSGKNQNVKLPAPVPVHLTYRTAWVDKDGTIQFRPDIYKRDAKMAQVMFK